MAATVANVEFNPIGGVGGRWIVCDITLDSAYAVGGEAVSAATLGFKVIKHVFVSDCEDGYSIDANIASAKDSVTFKVWGWGNSSQSAATPFDMSVRDLSAVTFGVLVHGL